MTSKQAEHIASHGDGHQATSRSSWQSWLSAPAKVLQRGIKGFGDLVIPPVCLGCKQPMTAHHTLCSSCWRSITFIGPPVCDRLGLPMPYDTGGEMVSAAAARHPPVYNKARFVAHYDGQMRHLIHDFKYRDQQDARRLFGRWLTTAGRELLTNANLIVPVPLYRSRLLHRRFNQSMILANEVSRLTGIPTDPFTLSRTRPTKQQVGLTLAQRQRNVRGAFQVPRKRRKFIANKNIVLIDDVVTTGATVESCAQVMVNSGAARVDVLSLARVTTSEVAEH
ncbi:MAG: ComF family protein [Hyphomicrobiaceae bacterium]